MLKSMIVHMLTHVIIYMLEVRNDGWDCKCTYINYVLDRYVLDFYGLNLVVDLTASLAASLLRSSLYGGLAHVPYAMLYFASLCTTSSPRYARFATLRSLLGPTYIYFFKNPIRTKKSQS